MKKSWFYVGVLAGAAALGSASFFAWQERGAPKGDGEEAIDVASSPLRPALPRADAPLVQNVDGLLTDGSPTAWGKIVSLYPGSDDETKRKILRHVAKEHDLARVIGYLLTTVGEDPTPAADDPMLEEAAAILKGRWKTPEDFDYGRQAMVMQKTDKRRWLLASGLVAFAKNVDEKSAFHPLKGSLEAKLIDVHSDAKDPFVKSSIVEGVRSLGGKDAALILAKGPNVSDDELEAVSERQRATDEVLTNDR